MVGVHKEVDFPRGGGGGGKAPRPKGTASGGEIIKKASAKVKKDDRDLFGSTYDSKHKVAKRKKEGRPAKDVAADEDFEVNRVESLSYGDLSEGMLVLGRVAAAVTDRGDVRISLPGRLTAWCPAEAVSSYYGAATAAAKSSGDDGSLRPLSQIMRDGQVVVCSVSKVTQSISEQRSTYRVQVSLDPAATTGSKLTKDVLLRSPKGWRLQAAVKSVEDHGFVMDLGVAGIRAFLPKAANKGKEDLGVGQLVHCCVAKADGINLNLTSDPAKLAHCCVSSSGQGFNVSKLIPGLAFDSAQVVESLEDGVKLRLVQGDDDSVAFVHKDHFERPGPQGEPEVGSQVKATILYVVPMLNTVYATLKPELGLCGRRPPEVPDFEPGHLLAGGGKVAEVVEVSPLGMLLKLHGSSKSNNSNNSNSNNNNNKNKNNNKNDDDDDSEKKVVCYGFVPKKHLPDEVGGGGGNKKVFKVGTVINSVRILAYDFADCYYICSLQKSALQNFVRKDLLKPGEKIAGTIARVDNKGIVVRLGKGQGVSGGGALQAFVPALHMSDVPLKHPEKKYSVGDKIKCKVLKVIAASSTRKKSGGGILLTAKNILVNEDFDVVADFDPVHVGKVTEGVVQSISKDGLLLQLFGEAKGWVPKKQLSFEGPIEYPEKLFFIGQALRCRVVSTEPEARRMTLSLIISGKRPLGSKLKKAVAESKVAVGHLYRSGRVVEVREDGLSVEFKVGRNRSDEDHDDDQDDGPTVQGFVPKQHLTDHPELADDLLNTYQVGDQLDSIGCFEQDVVPVMSLKPLVLLEMSDSYSSSAVKGFEELHEGQVLAGVVCSVKKYGVFLKLAAAKFRKSALVPTRLLADHFVENPSDLVAMHQTFFGRVVEKDLESQSITMSAKLSQLPPDGQAVCLLTSLFEGLAKIARRGPAASNGSTVTCTVAQDPSDDPRLPPGSFEALISGESCDLKAWVPPASVQVQGGVERQAVVIWSDPLTGLTELSLDPELVRKVQQSRKKRGSKVVDIVQGQKVKATLVSKWSLQAQPWLGFVTMCVEWPNNLAGRLVRVATRLHVNDRTGGAAVADTLANATQQHSVVLKQLLPDGEGSFLGVLERHDDPNLATIPDAVKASKPSSSSRKRKRCESDSAEIRQPLPEPTMTSEEATEPSSKKARKGSKKQKDINLSVLQSPSQPSSGSPSKASVKVYDDDVVKVAVDAKRGVPDDGETLWGQDYNPWALSSGVNAAPAGEAEGDDDGSGNNTKSGKPKRHLSKKEKKELDRLESEMVARTEQRVLDGEEAEPETEDEFERLVLASPDSSLCWIKYMAHHIGRKDYGRAREVAKRAVAKINFRLESEKLNVYMAWFNMENMAPAEDEDGRQERADACLKEALRCNDQYKVYSQVAAIHEASGNYDQAEKALKALARKFGREVEVWVLLGKHYFSRKDKDLKNARFSLQRALQSLDRKHHVELSSRFARLELEHGDPERGKQIFENIVTSFPRRLDQWNVYVDTMVKRGSLDLARELFDRMTSELNLPPKKMKAVFKKFLQFETDHGTGHSVERVRKLALEYVETKLGVKVEDLDEDAGGGGGGGDNQADKGDLLDSIMDDVDEDEMEFS